MQKSFYLITITMMLFCCGQSASSNNDTEAQENEQLKNELLNEIKNKEAAEATHPRVLLTTSDAEKILGEPAHITDSSWSGRDLDSTYLCTYEANAKDNVSGKTGTLYLLFERYADVPAAQQKYSFIKNANEKNGIKVLNNIGDEAYFHSDNQNFYFIMVRKGSLVFNMKVNKLTSKTSLEGFNQVAKKITDSL